MREIKRIVSIILLIGFLAGASEVVWAKVLPQSSDQLYVPETKHWIRGDFLRFYQNASDPLLLFGYPITDEFVDPETGLQTQYFQRAQRSRNRAADSIFPARPDGTGCLSGRANGRADLFGFKTA
jgi:hypothetical protein